MPPHPLTNFEIQKYYQNDLNLMEFFQEIIFMKKKIIKDGTYVINLDEYKMLVHIGLLYFVEKLKLFILIALVLVMFLKKLKNLSGIKT